VKAGVYWGHI